jgi:hypothetical protein
MRHVFGFASPAAVGVAAGACAWCGWAGAAAAQSAVYSVVFSTAGPVPSGGVVEGTMHCAWVDPTGIAYFGGAYRLRMDGLGVADVLSPNNSNDGVNGENSTDWVSVPASKIPLPGGPVTDRWSSGRRPRSAYLLDASDPDSVVADGGYRFPPLGTFPTNLRYRVEQHAGVTYLTGRNGQNMENWIENALFPPPYFLDPLLIDRGTDLELFKFQVRAPLSGAGTVTITPDVLSCAILTNLSSGAFHRLTHDQIQVVGGSFTYVPGPSVLAVLILGAAGGGRRVRGRPVAR